MFSAGEYFLGDGGVMTMMHLITVDVELRPVSLDKDFAKLVRGNTAWSKTCGASQIPVHLSSVRRQTDRLQDAGGGVCIGQLCSEDGAVALEGCTSLKFT